MEKTDRFTEELILIQFDKWMEELQAGIYRIFLYHLLISYPLSWTDILKMPIHEAISPVCQKDLLSFAKRFYILLNMLLFFIIVFWS